MLHFLTALVCTPEAPRTLSQVRVANFNYHCRLLFLLITKAGFTSNARKKNPTSPPPLRYRPLNSVPAIGSPKANQSLVCMLLFRAPASQPHPSTIRPAVAFPDVWVNTSSELFQFTNKSALIGYSTDAPTFATLIPHLPMPQAISMLGVSTKFAAKLVGRVNVGKAVVHGTGCHGRARVQVFSLLTAP